MRSRHMTLEIKSWLGIGTIIWWGKPVNGIWTSPLDNWICRKIYNLFVQALETGRKASILVSFFGQIMYSAPSFYRQPRLSPKFSSVPISPIKNTPLYCQTQLPPSPQVFRHKSRKTNLNSPVSTAHHYLLTAVYWSLIMECQDWSFDTVIDLIVEDRNRWVLIRIITCTMYLLF